MSVCERLRNGDAQLEFIPWLDQEREELWGRKGDFPDIRLGRKQDDGAVGLFLRKAEKKFPIVHAIETALGDEAGNTTAVCEFKRVYWRFRDQHIYFAKHPVGVCDMKLHDHFGIQIVKAAMTRKTLRHVLRGKPIFVQDQNFLGGAGDLIRPIGCSDMLAVLKAGSTKIERLRERGLQQFPAPGFCDETKNMCFVDHAYQGAHIGLPGEHETGAIGLQRLQCL